jgi:hypothetical protein
MFGTMATRVIGAKSLTGSYGSFEYSDWLIARADGAHEQRVAVARRLRGQRCADVAARARTVVDHDGLAERLAQLQADDAGQDVGGATGRERHDHGDRLGRIGALRLGAGHGGKTSCQCHAYGQQASARLRRLLGDTHLVLQE